MAIISGIVVGYLGTHASVAGLTGWSRLTDFDGRFPYGMTSPGQLGGSSSHAHGGGHVHIIPLHDHSGSATSSAPSDTYLSDNILLPSVSSSGHTHTIVVAETVGETDGGSLPAASMLPPYINVIMLESDAAATEIPADCLAWFKGTAAPNGWEIYSAAEDRLWRAASAGGDGGGTGGSSGSHDHSNHRHMVGGHIHLALGQTNFSTEASFATGTTPDGVAAHTHEGGGFAASTDQTGTGGNSSSTAMPPTLSLLPIRTTGPATEVPINTIVGYYGVADDIPFGYEPLDGLDGRLDLANRFPIGRLDGENVMAGELQHTHTVDAHTHTATHDHGAGTDNQLLSTGSTVYSLIGGSDAVAAYDHVHSYTPFATGNEAVTAESASGTSGQASNLPPYTGIIWLIKVAEFFGDPPRRRYNPHRTLPYRERVR